MRKAYKIESLNAPFLTKIFTTSLTSLKTRTFLKLSTSFLSNNSIIVFTFWKMCTSFCLLPLKKIVCAYIYITRIFGPCYTKKHDCSHPFLITLTPPVLNGSSFPLSTLSALILRVPAGGDPITTFFSWCMLHWRCCPACQKSLILQSEHSFNHWKTSSRYFYFKKKKIFLHFCIRFFR